jgi:AcrR family transcriptional regulator
MTEAKTTKTGRRARGSLSQEEILEAAKGLVEADGLAHLNMPALAKKLNSGVTSIYWYFRSKDELVTALTDKVAKEMYRGLPPVGEGPWDEELFSYFVAFRDLLNATPIYREVFAYRSQSLYTDGVLAPSVLRRLEAGLSVIVRAGIPHPDAARLFSACSNYTRGFVLLEHGVDAEDHEEIRDNMEAKTASTFARTNPEAYPTLAIFTELDSMFEVGDRDFQAGLRLILDGALLQLSKNR